MLLPLHDDNPLKNIRFQYVNVARIAACVAVFVHRFPVYTKSSATGPSSSDSSSAGAMSNVAAATTSSEVPGANDTPT